MRNEESDVRWKSIFKSYFEKSSRKGRLENARELVSVLMNNAT